MCKELTSATTSYAIPFAAAAATATADDAMPFTDADTDADTVDYGA